MTARFLVGTVFDGLASLPDTSVDLVLSSPPFLALRSYLPPDHPTKVKEIGSEATPADFLDTLLDVVEACDRVLAPQGSLVFELGDTYAGSGGAGGDYRPDELRDGQPRFDGSAARSRSDGAGGKVFRGGTRQPDKVGTGWPLDKSLTFMPQLFGASLAYGRNLLRPERTTEPWRIRNVVAWCRPNPPVGALGDKFRPATSYITVATKSRTRYFDLDAVRTEYAELTLKNKRRVIEGGEPIDNGTKAGHMPTSMLTHPGAPPLDWWEIPTQPYKGSHYATWPEDLLVRPIKAMCPERVCRVCGEPPRRIVEVSYVDANGRPAPKGEWRSGVAEGKGAHSLKTEERTTTTTTLGWTTCGHDDYRRGVVLDPFGGSGTTAQVATGLGRDCVLIDLDERNALLAQQRVGMFLEVETVKRHTEEIEVEA